MTASETVGGVPAYTIGNAISIVTGQQLREQQVRNGAEALRGLPGVEVSRSGGFGNFTQVRIRGAEGNQTLVLIDGIEASNLSDGEFDFSNLSAEDIERIEVIRGPMSGLYGSNAVGGCWHFFVTFDKDGQLTQARIDGFSPAWQALGDPQVTEFTLGAVPVPADATALQQFNIPAGSVNFNATLVGEFWESIAYSAFEGQSNRRTGSSGIPSRLIGGGSRG